MPLKRHSVDAARPTTAAAKSSARPRSEQPGAAPARRARRTAAERYLSDVLRNLAENEPLEALIDRVTHGVERLRPGMLCSAMLLDETGTRFAHCQGASLPEAYMRALVGQEIGPGRGSCGTAAATGQRVVVDDVSTHPYWAAFQPLVAIANVGSSWSQPIVGAAGRVLGTFAMYYRVPRTPDAGDMVLLEQAAQLVAVAIERQAAERALEQSRHLIEAIVDSIGSQIAVVDRDGRVVTANSRWRAQAGRTLHGELPELVGQPLALAWGGPLPEAAPGELGILEGLAAVFSGQQRRHSIEYAYREGRSERWLEVLVTPLEGERSRAVVARTDITERKVAEAAVRSMALQDPLTHLANRRLFDDRLAQSLALVHRTGQVGAVLMIDIDNFKQLNDTLGHLCGDAVLVEVAHRLRRTVRRVDTVARIGGDEFGVILSGLSHDHPRAQQNAEQVRQKLHDALRPAFRLDVADGASEPVAYRCQASIGLALIEPSLPSAQEALRLADAAMYAAKREVHRTSSASGLEPVWVPDDE